MLLSANVYNYAAVGVQYHEVTGGISMLRSSLAPLANGEIRGGMGFGGGAGYAYHFNQRMSLRTGLEMNSYSGTSYVNTINESSIVNIPTQEWDWWEAETHFEFQSHVKNYTVQQTSVYLQVPLLFGYEDVMPWVDWVTWYAHGGFKLGYSLFGSSNATVDSMIWSGDFPQALVTMGGNPDDAESLRTSLGLGTYSNYSQRQFPNFGFSSAAYLEVGVKQKLVQQYSLYVGIFGEYSLYSAVGSLGRNMYEYEPSAENENASFFNIQYTPASHTSTNGSRTFYPMSFGITVRFSFDTRRPEPSNNRMLQMRYLDF
jgi:hypothetical protein